MKHSGRGDEVSHYSIWMECDSVSESVCIWVVKGDVQKANLAESLESLETHGQQLARLGLRLHPAVGRLQVPGVEYTDQQPYIQASISNVTETE